MEEFEFDKRELKLPVWAQLRINRMRSLLRDYEFSASQESLTNRESTIFHWNRIDVRGRPHIQYLPEGSEIGFKTGDGDFRVKQMKDQHFLDINSDREIRLHPRAANSLYVELVPIPPRKEKSDV